VLTRRKAGPVHDDRAPPGSAPSSHDTDIEQQAPLLGLTALGAIAEVLVPGDDGYAGTAAALFADGTPDLVVRPPDAAGWRRRCATRPAPGWP
jgi:hypothetical protein